MSEPDSASPNLAAPRDMTRVIAFDATGPVNQPALDTLEFFRQSLVVTDARRDPADPGRLRIGWCTASAVNPAPHSEALQAAEDAAVLLTELGHEVERLPRQPFDDRRLAEDFLTG